MPAWLPAARGEQFILDGRVAVNGHVVRLLGRRWIRPTTMWRWTASPSAREKSFTWPCTSRRAASVRTQDELGRPTIYDLLPKEWQMVNSVGRLDFNSGRIDFSDQ